MIDLFVEFVKAVWLLLPAYAANGFPPLARGSHPMDFGKNFFDGQRLFGDGKTWEGFSLGLFIGTLVGVLEAYLYPDLNAYAMLHGASLPRMDILVGFLIAFGALSGDLAGGFIKRRLKMPRGADAPGIDQLNFVIGMILFVYWFTDISLWMIAIMIIITPVIHRIANIIGYVLKFKQVPW